MKLPALIAILALSLTACSEPQIEAGDGPALVTVFSEAGQTQPPRDGLYASYGLGIESGATLLDAAGLASLTTHQLTADFPVGSDLREFAGPRLSDLLTASGADGAGARLTAADGYQVEVPAEMISRHQPVFATHVNGEPLALGSLGPGILIWPRQSDNRLEDMNDDLWVWGVFAIEALES